MNNLTAETQRFNAEVDRVAAKLVRDGTCAPFDAVSRARDIVLGRRREHTQRPLSIAFQRTMIALCVGMLAWPLVAATGTVVNTQTPQPVEHALASGAVVASVSVTTARCYVIVGDDATGFVVAPISPHAPGSAFAPSAACARLYALAGKRGRLVFIEELPDAP